MIRVSGTCTMAADKMKGAVSVKRVYKEATGLACRQIRETQYESDYVNGSEYRESPDNGHTWGPWIPVEQSSFTTMYGEDEMQCSVGPEVWNPVHGHYVSTYFTRYFLKGHNRAYELWDNGKEGFYDHQYLQIRRPGEKTPYTNDMIRYEEGADFDPQNPGNPDFLKKNRGYLNHPIVLQNGDVAVPVGVPVRVGCRLAGLKVEEVFPSCPDITLCVIVARGTFNPHTQKYQFTFSNPVILSDLRSSRGIDEPVLAELKSGRLLLIMRGSNTEKKTWNTRIEKGAPSFKWYSWSDDGGKTFMPAEPWHFDDGEVVYSSATLSNFIRSVKTGKLYWIGNITPHTAYSNYPRYPLQIVEVDEQTGAAKKESLTVIDTRHEGETEFVQLSNFHVLEDRETGNLELTLFKYCQFDAKEAFYGESWQYEIYLE